MSDATIAHLRPTKPCPICAKPSVRAFHPFCSERCANIDLNRWLSGSYVIPAKTEDAPDEEKSSPFPDYEEDKF